MNILRKGEHIPYVWKSNSSLKFKKYNAKDEMPLWKYLAGNEPDRLNSDSWGQE
jgi:hypothetical protein